MPVSEIEDFPEGPNSLTPQQLNETKRMIKAHEGWSEVAYKDPVSGWETPTIGWGRTKNADGSKVKKGDTTTKEKEEDHLSRYIDETVKSLNSNQVPLEPALISSIYNFGIGNFLDGSLPELARQKKWSEFADKMEEYIKARETENGPKKVLRGLIVRRRDEANQIRKAFGIPERPAIDDYKKIKVIDVNGNGFNSWEWVNNADKIKESEYSATPVNNQTQSPAPTPTPTPTPAPQQTGFFDKVKEYGGKAYDTISDTLFPSAEASPMPVNSEEEIPEFKMPETEEEIPEFKMPETEPKKEEVFAPPRKETSKLKAGILGGLQGLTFGFADELEAVVRSSLGKDTYEQALPKARKGYKEAQEDQPWTYGGSELGVGIASSFIPVVGQLGAAGVAARAGKAAKDVITAKKGVEAASKGARAAEVLASGAVGGGLGSVGTSEADLLAKQTPEAAAELAKDIGTGALTGAAFGKATQSLGDSETTQKIAKRIRESKPVKAAENLLDTAISGGKDAVEQGRIFIGKPEKVKEVEQAFKAGGFENVKEAQKDVKTLVRAKAKDTRDITKLTNEYNQTKRQLQDEINDVKRTASTERNVQQMELGKQTEPLRKEYNDVKQALNKLGPQIDATEQKIQAQVQQLNKSLDNQSAEAIKNLYDNQIGKINELGKQRDKFLDSSLSKVSADEADAQQLQDAIVDMYSIYKNDYETSIVPVLTKILRNEPRFEQMSNIVTDKNRIANIKDAVLQGKYSKAEVIKMIENAKKELYTPMSNTTPSGVARREAYQILNEKLRTIAPDEYNQFNRELNKFMTTRDVLEDSPLLKGFTVTKTGQKGGQIAETQYMPVTERPSIEKLPKDYLDELQSKGFDVSLLQRQEKILEDALTKEQLLPLETMKAELTIKSNALRRQIQELRSKASMSSAEEQVKLNDLINKKTDDLNLYRSKMTMKLSKMREDLADKYAEKIGQARDNLEALEEQARKETIAYSDLAKSGITADEAARMVSTGTIGRQMPQGFYRLLRPTPMTRIKVYNAISKRFRNPALTAAIAPRIGQGLTDEDIMSLSTTHEVDPNELKQVLTEQGMSAP